MEVTTKAVILIQTSWRLYKRRAFKLEVREKEDLCMVCGNNELDKHKKHLCTGCVEQNYDVSKCKNCNLVKFTDRGYCVECWIDEHEEDEEDFDENTCRTCYGDLGEGGKCYDCLTELWRDN